ncbi:DNA-directed RNA polymerase subunit alpha [candidate division WOR-1 bacterium RIFOXYB2_FULL_42_35]|uniref:DNA-directed RNA polymerase subunit alpha n=1 Tax=candidate division WOR-1 bacterium RIFOXYC2_FULL_41_25 TaxID=1802586 RepID=A0A1F4TNV3_UNCSA|nr:MAG: DNA-directed RNA polymerase subunit alpha [candidate division WOR-1 bacterium RIFOXYA2_FULL_41_14]OGC23878.1 MAG: DNA-directed RNA polymerase subunit alpha [candidate division WOR-1 bacterium RIFOXYB2_FULL_42_35]OGC33753.1 MAG: DNA-directed RNA polymerase subunit alpha [candidate division WOR-1 bacterium RIFOXYC2_FULL_41_25]OGC44176.1 MAG: DNA-directed RNA polymerase subunit alpha [candidate division WOR-1 bacterium RIFOXYD2_FULL_41_8]
MVSIGEKPWVRIVESSDTYGQYVVEPLDRGYGSTLGNSLRRVLLSSLYGAAITAVKIEGIDHSFSTIPGVVEDVLQIMLNLKEVVIRSHSEQPKTVKLKVKGKGEVTAADIEHDAEIEIVNPDHKIATLDTAGKLEMEIIIERGKGYVPSERNKKSTLAVGFLPTDSIFTPVLKVNLATEEVRVGQEINYDRLVLSVWTNGSVNPDAAVKESANILAKHVELFVHLGEKVEILGIGPEKKDEIGEGILEMNVEDLELSARSLNCLKNAGLNTVGELIANSLSDLMKFKNFGAKSLDEVQEKLTEYKLTLKGERGA